MSDRRTSDELEIRSLVERYSDAVNRRSDSDWGATWARDGVWHMMGQAHEGRDAIVAQWKTMMDWFELVVQLPSAGVIEWAGDTARGRFTLTEIARPKQGDPMTGIYVYNDEYVKEDGHWCFASREFTMLYQGPPDLSGNVFPWKGD